MRKEFWKRVRFTLLIVTIMQLGQKIVIPQLNKNLMIDMLTANPFLRVFTTATGASYSKPALFSIGMGPYMFAMIFMSALQALKILNKASRQFMAILQKSIILGLAFLQAWQLVSMLGKDALTVRPGENLTMVKIYAVIILIGGAMLVTWLADMNNGYGVGGLGIMIVPGIISSTIQTFSGQSFEATPLNILMVVIVTLSFLVMTIFMNRGELRIPLKHVTVDNALAESYYPVKVLLPGVMPLMFSRVILMLPTLFIKSVKDKNVAEFLTTWFSTTTPQGILMYAIIIVLLGYLFSYMSLTPSTMAEDFQKSGDYLANVRPGIETEKFLRRVFYRTTFVGNSFSVLVACIPLVIGLWYPIAAVFSFYFINLFMMVTILQNINEQIQGMFVSSRYSLI